MCKLHTKYLYLQLVSDARSQPKTASDVNDFAETEDGVEVLFWALSLIVIIPVLVT